MTCFISQARKGGCGARGPVELRLLLRGARLPPTSRCREGRRRADIFCQRGRASPAIPDVKRSGYLAVSSKIIEGSPALRQRRATALRRRNDGGSRTASSGKEQRQSRLAGSVSTSISISDGTGLLAQAVQVSWSSTAASMARRGMPRSSPVIGLVTVRCRCPVQRCGRRLSAAIARERSYCAVAWREWSAGSEVRTQACALLPQRRPSHYVPRARKTRAMSRLSMQATRGEMGFGAGTGFPAATSRAHICLTELLLRRP